MYELIYISKTNKFQNRADILELLNQSRTRNAELDITGLLVYHNGNFMQLLEGEKDIVKKLMEVIRQDSRHHDVLVIYEDEIDKRSFKNWSMAFSDMETAEAKNIEGYSDFLEDGFNADWTKQENITATQSLIMGLKNTIFKD